MTTDTPENTLGALETDLDWENRRLCSDDSCIGVIGADGGCRVCGLLNTTEAPVGSDRYGSVSAVQEEIQYPSAENQVLEPQDSEWEDRKLCLDESCVGAIGADGRCNVCGLTG